MTVMGSGQPADYQDDEFDQVDDDDPERISSTISATGMRTERTVSSPGDTEGTPSPYIRLKMDL